MAEPYRPIGERWVRHFLKDATMEELETMLGRAERDAEPGDESAVLLRTLIAERQGRADREDEPPPPASHYAVRRLRRLKAWWDYWRLPRLVRMLSSTWAGPRRIGGRRMTMTRHSTVWCDKADCGEWHISDSAADARREAKANGWTRRRDIDGSMIDLCPEHGRKGDVTDG